jgi:hypothetical protein
MIAAPGYFPINNKVRTTPMINRFFLNPKRPVNLNRIFILAAMALGISTPATAQDFLLAPYRVVLEGNARSSEIALVNRGSKRGTYRVEFVDMVMDDKQELVEGSSTAKGEKFAKSMLRASVRQVELDPGETQMIRIAVRKPADLPAGEYRTHLMVRSLPDVAPPQLDPKSLDRVSFTMIPAYGMTIPVLVRQGRPVASAIATSADISNIDTEGFGLLNVGLKRSGDRSMFVDVDIVTAPAKGKGVWVTTARGVALYAPYDGRMLNLQVNKGQIERAKGQKLKVLVTEIEPNGKQIAKPVEAIF